ncbi:RAxF-45 family protein [Kurthia sibirica]|nr:RAxF-45 family protein [Kurthia sibirica]GEK32782.1 hypothetical protein KSI01_03150 [Kurthia sibirica]
MMKSTIETCVQLDTAMYYARVITFDFDAKGITMSFFNNIKKSNNS